MKFFRRRSDLPLRGDATSRFLPWLIAPMVFLSAMALSGAIVTGDLVSRWERDTSGSLTIEIAPSTGDSNETAEQQSRQRVETTLRILRTTPGVIKARSLSEEELDSLLKVWLGPREMIHDLPLPALIDVIIKDDGTTDLSALADKLARQVPGASIDDHRLWLAHLVKLSRSIEKLAIGILFMIGAVTVSTILFATRSGMAVHRNVIDLLHIIGAPDSYIARQFAWRAFILGLYGGFIGLAMALPVMFWIGHAESKLQAGLLSGLSLPVEGWLWVMTLPIFSALLSLAIAWESVNRSLDKIP